MKNQTVLLFCIRSIAIFLSTLSVSNIGLEANANEFKGIEKIEVNDHFLDISIDSSVIEIDNKTFLIRKYFKRFFHNEICQASRKLSVMFPQNVQRGLEEKVQNIDYKGLTTPRLESTGILSALPRF